MRWASGCEYLISPPAPPAKAQDEVPTPKPRPSAPATQALNRHDQRAAGGDHARGFNPLCFPAALVTTVMSLGTLTVFCN